MLVPLVAAADRCATWSGEEGAGRRALSGFALAAAAALASFLIANPYAVLDYTTFHSELVHQSTLSAEAQGKLGAPQTGRPHLLPVVAHLGSRLGARAGGAGRRADRVAPQPRLGWLLVPPVVAYLLFMGLQGRYFGRWLLPIFPILCLLAAYFALLCAEALARRLGAGADDPAAREGRGARGLRAGLIAAVRSPCAPRGSCTASTPTACSRAPTRAP